MYPHFLYAVVYPVLTLSSLQLEENAYNNHLYRVKKGSVRVEKGEKLIAKLPEASMFGEMSVLHPDGKTFARCEPITIL